MRQLWADVRHHPVAAALFLVYWLVAWAVAILTWSKDGMSAPAAAMLMLGPVLAGGLVGWWRAPAREGLFVGRGHLAGGPLAGALVMLADVTVIFAADGLDDLRHGAWKWQGVLVWLGWCIVFGLLALVLGLVGSFLGASLARVMRPPAGS
jgi:hypothetical protein